MRNVPQEKYDELKERLNVAYEKLGILGQEIADLSPSQSNDTPIEEENNEIIFSDGKYYPSTPGTLSDEEIERLMMDEFLRTHPEENREDLEVIRGMGAMDDENGNIYEPYAIGRKSKESENVEYDEEIISEGEDLRYYQDSPLHLTDAEIEQRMLDQYLRYHPELDAEDLFIIRGMGVMDDENGNLYEPYSVGRRVKKETEEEKEPEYEEIIHDDIIYNTGKFYRTTPRSLTDSEIEAMMLEQFKNEYGKDHDLSELDESKLHVIRGVGAESDLSGDDLFEPFSVSIRTIERREKQEVTEEPQVEEDLEAEREEVIESVANDSDKEEIVSANDERLQELEQQIVKVKEEVDELIAHYEDNIKKMNDLITDLQAAVDNDNYDQLKQVNNQINEIKKINDDLKKDINEAKNNLESIQEKKELVEADMLAEENLTPEEYREITNTLRNKELVRKVLKDKGIYDIYRKDVDERTPEEQDQIRAALREAIDEIADAKLENRDASILDIVQALYNIEDEIKMEETPREEVMASEEVQQLTKKANELPAAVARRESDPEVSYEPEAAPEDMQDVMNAQEDEYVVEQIFDGGKYYPSRPGALSDEEIEQEMMDEFLRTHPEETGEDLEVIRGMGAMDDENGNIYEPYAIGRRVKKDVPDHTIVIPDEVINPDPIIPVPPVEEVIEEHEEVTKKERDLRYTEILAEIVEGTGTVSKKEVDRYNANNLRCWQTFKDELHSGQKDYNVFHFSGAVTRLVGSGIRKLTGKLLLTEEGREKVELINERLNNLEPEKLQVLYDEYVGNNAMQNLDFLAINDLVMARMSRWIMEKVQVLNDEIRECYDKLFVILGERDEIDKQLESTEDQSLFDALSQRYADLMSQGAEIVKTIMAKRAEGDKLLGHTGLHGMEEVFKAVRTGMNYVGLRHHKKHDLVEEDIKELSKFGGQLKSGLATGNNQDIVDGFLGEETIYAEGTEIKKGIMGDKSVGTKYYLPLLQKFDYRDDPYIKDLFATLAMVSATAGAINAIRVHHFEAHEVLRQEQEKARLHNKQIDSVMGKVHSGAKEQISFTDKYQEGMKFQANHDVVTVSDALERKAVDMTGWKFGDKYRALDDANHEFYNGFYDDVSSQINSIAARHAKGAIDAQQSMNELINVANSSSDTLVDVCKNCLEVMEKYSATHPQFDLDGVRSALEYVSTHPNALTEMNDAIGRSVEISHDLLGLSIDHYEALIQLPSDMLTTLMACAGSTALAHRVFNEMRNKGYTTGKKYDDSITNRMRNHNYLGNSDEEDLEDDIEDSNEPDEPADVDDEDLEDENQPKTTAGKEVDNADTRDLVNEDDMDELDRMFADALNDGKLHEEHSRGR